LVEQAQLTERDSALEFVATLKASEHRVVETRLEEPEHVLARVLRRIEGEVGIPELFRARTVGPRTI